MGDAIDCHLTHCRMLGEDNLHFPGIDIFPTADDEVAAAIDDGEESLFLHPGEIPGIDPAVTDRLPGCRLVAPVTDHPHGGLTDDDLARLADGRGLTVVFHN